MSKIYNENKTGIMVILLGTVGFIDKIIFFVRNL